jgi:hypothetical protein
LSPDRDDVVRVRTATRTLRSCRTCGATCCWARRWPDGAWVLLTGIPSPMAVEDVRDEDTVSIFGGRVLIDVLPARLLHTRTCRGRL